MTEKKSLVEEAILQMKNLEETIAENAKGILASTMRQEIKDLVKESLKEQDDEEIEDEEGDEMEMDDESMEMDDESMEFDDEEMDMTEPDTEVDTIDLTNEPTSEVLRVFKLLSPEDEIVVTKDSAGNINLKDNETDKEYMIVSESMMDEMYHNEEDTDEFMEYDETMMYEDEDEDELEIEFQKEFGEEDTDELMEYDETMMDEMYKESEMYEEDSEDEFYLDDEQMSETIYEIELETDEDFESEEFEEYMMESKKTMKPKGFGIGHGPKFEYEDVKYKKDKMKKADEAPFAGKGPKYNFDKKSPSLRGEFKEAKYGMNKGEKSKTHKGEEDYTGKKGMESKTHKGLDFKRKETKEASRTLGNGKYWGREGLPKPKAAPRHIRKESVESQEVNLLREKNEEYRKALNIFRNKLNEVAIFNSNLAYATRLFTEHSTSKQEKITILKRFDGVETLKESKNLYKTIKDELSSSMPQQVNESIERTISKTPSTGSAINLIESKTYENPQFMRMKDLMSKLK